MIETPYFLRLTILFLMLSIVGAWYASINDVSASSAQAMAVASDGIKIRLAVQIDSTPKPDADFILVPFRKKKHQTDEPPTNF